MGPIDENCPCPTCTSKMSRALIHHLVTAETAMAHGEPLLTTINSPPDLRAVALTQHNIVFQAQLMGGARDAIIDGTFPDYLRKFFAKYFGAKGYPKWCVDALRSVGVDILEGVENPIVLDHNGAKWEYANE